MQIGDNIKEICKKKGISIYTAMKKSNISTGYFYELVNNKQTNPTIDIVKKIAASLEVTIDELVN